MAKPKIRFKGYTDDWEQRKLGETCQITMGQSPDGSTYSDEPSDYILVQGNADLKDGWVFPRIWTTQKTKTAQAGDLIMSVRAPAGAMGKTAYDVVLGRGVAGIKGNEFIYQTLVKHDADGYWKKLAAGSTFDSINSDVVNNAIISLPQDMAEQEKIGAYFSNLDHLITLHQRKCEETKKLKKYMLQKMFPQNGQTVPEIRFAGFTNAWEQRKLDDVAEFSKGNGYSKGDLIEVGTPIILYGRLYTKYETSISDVDTYVEAKEGSVYSKGGEVIVPASGETAEDIARAATVDKSGILLGGDLNVVMPNKDINSAFMAISISNGNSQRELAKKAQGKSVVHIHNEEIRNLIVPFPNKVEQDKIVDYFTNLDHLITLHQHKCEQLQNMKKYMLQNMFV